MGLTVLFEESILVLGVLDGGSEAPLDFIMARGFILPILDLALSSNVDLLTSQLAR